MNTVDIAIPTHNRAAELALTLEGLTRLTQPEGIDWRIIVVANNCTDHTPHVVEQFADRLGTRLVCEVERRPGLCHARNAAIRLSQADVIAFLDDDVDVEPYWLQALCQAFREEACDAVGGRAELRFPDARPNWIGITEESLLSRVDRGPVRRICSPDEICGLNLAIKRCWFEKIGCFRIELGRVGTSLISGDETDVLRRIAAAGGKLIYEPAAFLWHRIPPSRLHKQWFLQRHYWGVRSTLRIAPMSRPQAAVCAIRGGMAYGKGWASLAWRACRNGLSSDVIYQRQRWIAEARAEVDEALHTLFASGFRDLEPLPEPSPRPSPIGIGP
ncbi:MAG: glycosyltransferase [Pirellulaceae bacterium]